MKDQPRQQFRSAPHVSGLANAKPKDYEAGIEIEAASEYAAWAAMRVTDQPLNVGDLLEADGKLRICKYVGFEEAQWFVPEPTHQKSGRLPEESVEKPMPVPPEAAQAAGQPAQA